jgi:hypothetical protein
MHHQPELKNHIKDIYTPEKKEKNGGGIRFSQKLLLLILHLILMRFHLYLNPIGKNLTVASVRNQFFWKLGDTGV